MPFTQEFIESLIRQNQVLIEQNNTPIEQVETLNKTIEELNAREQLNKNSGNSSKPPSSDV